MRKSNQKMRLKVANRRHIEKLATELVQKLVDEQARKLLSEKQAAQTA